MAAEVINKITITAEAVFDYTETLGLPTLDKRRLKTEVEDYINIKNRSGRLFRENYFRCKYLDEDSGRMLMLFLYRAERVSVMQNWLVRGICFAEDWTEDAEDDGLIRCWLKCMITELPDGDDWAVSVRTNKILRETGKTAFENVLKEVLDDFECERDKKTAEKLAFLQSLYFERGRGRPKKKSRGGRALYRNA